MGKITQDKKFRQALLKHAEKYGVTAAARKYKTTRQYAYYWRERWDGTAGSLGERSRRPRRHPKERTEGEKALIREAREANPRAGLVVLRVKLGLLGYSRSVAGLFRAMRRPGLVRDKAKNPKKRRSKPYERMTRPGERFQIDVKYVPAACITGEVRGNGWLRYTALDEYSRRFVAASEEHNTQTSKLFLERLVKIFRGKIERVQTDNGSEFTNRFASNTGKQTAFERALSDLGIRRKLIRPFTPWHNGKVERSHRKDNERFYALNSFSSFKDFKQKLKAYNIKDYNCFPTRPLNWKSPQQVLLHFLRNDSVINV